MSQADRDVSEKGEKTAQAAAESTSASFVPSVPLSVQVKAGCHELMDAKKKEKKKDPGTQTFVCMCVRVCAGCHGCGVYHSFYQQKPRGKSDWLQTGRQKGSG